MKRQSLILVIMVFSTLSSCTKDILDRKPDQSQVVPTTIADYQAILDNQVKTHVDYLQPAEIAAGDFYLNYADYQSLTAISDQKNFIWAKDIWQGSSAVGVWDNSYTSIFYTNVALDGLKAVTPSSSNQLAYDNAKGMALYARAEAFYNLAQLFAKPYDSSTAGTDLGIPLRLASDLNVKTTRSTLQQTYDQITDDLTQAVQLLPAMTSTTLRPGKAAANALLARVYLSMGNYSQALKYANNSLTWYSTLIDYNTLSTTASSPFPYLTNKEVTYHTYTPNLTIYSRTVGKIDQNLYNSYSANDLRKSIFFTNNTDGSVGFKGLYSGLTFLFSGMTTDEQYLVRAECYARNGQPNEAMADLNTLLKMRFKTGTFAPLSAVNADDALNQIIFERRKELIFRCLRWTDLRRLNKDPRFAVTLTRVLNGVTYTLSPNDPRYVLPIPDYIIQATGIEQNQR